MTPAQATGASPEPTPPPAASVDTGERGVDQGTVGGGILLWGGPNSGKSTYAASLVFHREREGEVGSTDWHVMPVDMVSAEFVGDVVLAYRDGKAPPKTDVIQPLRFRITELTRPSHVLGLSMPDRIRREAVLSFMDPKGEIFLQNLAGEQGAAVMRLVSEAFGILLLIDPTARNQQAQNAHLRMFVLNLQKMIQMQGPLGAAAPSREPWATLNVPMAICVTKMDRFPPGTEPSELLIDTVGNAGYRTLHIAVRADLLQVFGVSALGLDVVDDGGVMRPANGLAQPWNVLTPLMWLMDRRPRRR